MLAARFRRPWPIIAGILIATSRTTRSPVPSAPGSHARRPRLLRWVLGLSFSRWRYDPDPDKIDDDELSAPKFGVLGTTIVAFFLAGWDKTQIATVALAAQYGAYVAVVAGTTFGMMIANVPAVIAGDRVANRLPVRLIHGVAAIFSRCSHRRAARTRRRGLSA